VENKEELYRVLADFVFKNTGIFYGERDYYRLDSRIDKMIRESDVASEEELLKSLKQSTDKEFLAKVIDVCTNNETFFFRDQNPFNALRDHILPELLEKKKLNQLNIWSCACSSGQEPLSIMMTIKEKYPDFSSISMEATDISQTILEKAKSGIYNSLEAQRGISIQLLIKYFDQVENNCWKVKSDLIDKIQYKPFNLFSEFYPSGKYDVLFCRNVLIYQNMENKNKILQKLFQALKPGGYLIMGAGESLIGSDIKLEQKTLSGTMVFYKQDLNSFQAA
tara:strand:- start:2702 stop:3538 length:837 start_codon:yes stop_codon:yes gene_type:complete